MVSCRVLSPQNLQLLHFLIPVAVGNSSDCGIAATPFALPIMQAYLLGVDTRTFAWISPHLDQSRPRSHPRRAESFGLLFILLFNWSAARDLLNSPKSCGDARSVHQVSEAAFVSWLPPRLRCDCQLCMPPLVAPVASKSMCRLALVRPMLYFRGSPC